MADLGSKATDGKLSFIKYVTDNKRFSELDYEIEKGKNTVVYTLKNKELVPGVLTFRAGTKLKILNKDLLEIGKMKVANVKIGSTVGYVPINTIRKPTPGNGTQYEDEVVEMINSYIMTNGGSVDFRLKGSSQTYRDISYAVKVDSGIKSRAGVKGDPKADIILCKKLENPTGDGSIYISHKKEGGPEAFQQYGGLSEQAGAHIYNHKLVQEFLSEVAKTIGTTGKLPKPMMGEFKDDTLANMSIYGPEYGKAYSLQHTQLIGQGKPVFTKKGNVVELSFSSHMSLSGDLSHFTGGYLPVFGATFRAGRSFAYGGQRYNGARVAIYPYKLVATRSDLVKVKLN